MRRAETLLQSQSRGLIAVKTITYRAFFSVLLEAEQGTA